MGLITKVVRFIGMSSLILGIIFFIGWYVGWLDQFIPYLLACALGVITAPLAIFALLFDLFKNGITLDFLILVSLIGFGMAVNSIAYFLEKNQGGR